VSHITGSPQATTQVTAVAPAVHTPPAAAPLGHLDAEFPPWHCWWSYDRDGWPARVNATRCRSGHGRRGWAPSGETLDAAGPAEMADLLTAQRRTP
jgi:hypothetical protein